MIKTVASVKQEIDSLRKEGTRDIKMTAKTHAFWEIYLHCECPGCHEDVDLLDYDDFWDGRRFQACENHTDRTRGVDVVCPECGHEFEVDLEY